MRLLLDYPAFRRQTGTTMQKSWQDLGLWFLGLLVMVLGAGFPIYLFHSEGAESLFGDVVYVLAGVQTDKTAQSIREVMKELRGFVGDKPVTHEELEKTVKNRALSLSGKWETAGAVLGSLSEIVQYDLPDDYYDNYARRIMNLDTTQIQRVAKKIINPDALTWVVVGDRQVIEDDLEALDMGPITLIDADGNVLEQQKQ